MSGQPDSTGAPQALPQDVVDAARYRWLRLHATIDFVVNRNPRLSRCQHEPGVMGSRLDYWVDVARGERE